VIGGEGLHAALRERGLVPVTSADDDPKAVVQGYAPDVDWRALAEGTYAVRRGVPWIASNLDATVPTPRGLAPGNGALVGVIAATTGVLPVAAGKPEIALHEESMRRTGARRPLVVGDRLDTDIEGANRAGVPSLLVLTGVATPSDLMPAAAPLRPSYLAADLRSGLLAPHPVVVGSAAGWTCRGRTVTPAGEIVGEGEDIDALRAACVAAWSGEADVQALGRSVERLVP
jgi:glycerol-1-phosphatase